MSVTVCVGSSCNSASGKDCGRGNGDDEAEAADMATSMSPGASRFGEEDIKEISGGLRVFVEQGNDG